MFVTPAYAQGAGGGGGADFITSFIPIILLIAIFWFLIFRPQQKRIKTHQAMIGAIRRGDTIVTNGGLVGKVVRAAEGEDLEVEIAQGTRVRVVRSMVADVRTKSEPINDNKPEPAPEAPNAAPARRTPTTTRKSSTPRKPTRAKKED